VENTTTTPRSWVGFYVEKSISSLALFGFVRGWSESEFTCTSSRCCSPQVALRGTERLLENVYSFPHERHFRGLPYLMCFVRSTRIVEDSDPFPIYVMVMFRQESENFANIVRRMASLISTARSSADLHCTSCRATFSFCHQSIFS